MAFRIEYKASGSWKQSRNCQGTFDTLDQAYTMLEQRGDSTSLYRIRGTMSDQTWFEGKRPFNFNKEVEMSDPLSSQTEPLNLDREAVIEALQAKVVEESDKRAAEQAKLDEARKEAIQAIEAFSPQELYEIFRINFTVEAEDLLRYHDEERYVPKPIQAGKTETDLERAVRVLGMGTDKTVQVAVGTDLYSLL